MDVDIGEADLTYHTLVPSQVARDMLRQSHLQDLFVIAPLTWCGLRPGFFASQFLDVSDSVVVIWEWYQRPPRTESRKCQ